MPPPATGACDPLTVPRRGQLFGGFEAVWRCHKYEYYSEALQDWSAEQPAECRLQTEPLSSWAARMAQQGGGLAEDSPRPSTWTQQERASQASAALAPPPQQGGGAAQSLASDVR